MVADGPIPVHLAQVLDGLAGNPALPAELVRRLLRHQHGFGEVARRPDLTAEAMEEILASGQHWLLHSLALNPRLPHAVRLRLAAHPDPEVRRRVAGHPQLPPPVRALLAADSSPTVRVGIFGRRDTPEEVRQRIHQEIQQGDRPLVDPLDDEFDDETFLRQVEHHSDGAPPLADPARLR